MTEPVIFPLMLIRTAGLPFAALQTNLPDWSGLQALEGAGQVQLKNAFEELQVFEQVRITDPSDSVQKEVMNLRRKVLKMRWPESRSAIRCSPLLEAQQPDLYQKVAAWNAALENLEQLKAQQNDQYQLAMHQQAAFLQQFAQSEWLQRALLFSSHALLQQLPAFALQKLDHLDKKDRQVLLSIWQYQSRGATKTAPLSRFTTLECHRWESEPMPVFFTETKAIATPNVAFLPVFYEVLLQFPVFYTALKVQLNPSLQRQDGQLGFLYFDGTRESFQQVPENAVLNWLVPQLQSNGAEMLFPMLKQLLLGQIEASEPDIEAYILELIDVGLLEWQLPEKGLTASWCSNLYQFLGFLPTEAPIVEAAHLLTWLRTAARTLAFLSVEEARVAQEACLDQLSTYFTRYGVPMPPIPAEQVFFEDVSFSEENIVPPAAITNLATAVHHQWQASAEHVITGMRAQLQVFGKKCLSVGTQMPFLDFCKAFMQDPSAQDATENPVYIPAYSGKIGMMLQPFLENGQWRAVINGLYPGGGKMYARWLHLFSNTLREQLEPWMDAIDAYPFPWHDWNNANFQPLTSTRALRTPDARRNTANGLDLNALWVRHAEHGEIVLWDDQQNKRVHLIDLGLEAPSVKPPVFQLLWHLGTPYVSVAALLPKEAAWVQLQPACFYRPRIEAGPLVLFRASWRLDAAWCAQFSELKNADFFFAFPKACKSLNIPSQFFARINQEKPQYFDQNNPISMLQLEKWMRQHPASLWITEMLPLPAQAGKSATELVLEIG